MQVHQIGKVTKVWCMFVDWAAGHAIVISGLAAMCLTSRWVFAHLKQAWLSLDALDGVPWPDGEALV